MFAGGGMITGDHKLYYPIAQNIDDISNCFVPACRNFQEFYTGIVFLFS